jgi:hypothetical protein
MSITKLCDLDGMPDRSTLFRWLAKHSDFRDLYVRAREFQTELGYDDMAALADAPFTHNGDIPVSEGGTGIPLDAGMAMAEMQRRKLQIDIIKFKLVKLQAKRFGENRNVDVNVKITKQVSPEQFEELLGAAKSAPKMIDEGIDDAEVLNDD